MLKKIVDVTCLLVVLFFIILIQNHYSSLFPQDPEYMPANEKPEVMYFPQSENVNNPPFLIYHGSRDKKQIALTFDADMTKQMENELLTGRVSSWYNEKLITELTKTDTPATLFLTGLWAQVYPQQARKLAQNPLFEIGNHSMDHPSLGGNCYGLPIAPTNTYGYEIENAQKEIEKSTGVLPKLFRFPGGCGNRASLSILKKMNMHVVYWDDVSGDSYLKSATDIAQTAVSQAKNGSIIVMHMHDPEKKIAGDTADAIPIIIAQLKQKGYTFVTISQLMHEQTTDVSYLQKNMSQSIFSVTPTQPPYLTQNLEFAF